MTDVNQREGPGKTRDYILFSNLVGSVTNTPPEVSPGLRPKCQKLSGRKVSCTPDSVPEISKQIGAVAGKRRADSGDQMRVKSMRCKTKRLEQHFIVASAAIAMA